VAGRYETLVLELRDDGVAIVTMNRPEKMNAMNKAFFRDLIAVMDEMDDSDDVAVAILTGAGRAFSAGGDIASFAELSDVKSYRRHLRLVYNAFHRVETAEVPVVAAVNGIAFGGGTELVLACDLAIASDRARFAFKEPTVGLMPGYGVIRGPEIIGKRATRYLAMTGIDVDAARARELGLVEEVVPHAELTAKAEELASQLAANAPFGVRLAKQFINRGQDAPGIPESIEATALLFTTNDHKEGVQAFLGKRTPDFRGK
jgi:enoyl-CoA hydratase/carnithine racemase